MLFYNETSSLDKPTKNGVCRLTCRLGVYLLIITKKMNKKRIVIGLVAVIVVIVLIAVYMVSNNQPVNNTIKVGVIAPMSGPYGSLGESIVNAIRMNVDGNENIKLVVEDSKFDAKIGLSAFQKLTSIDNVDLIINVDSPTLSAITPIVNKTKLPVIQIFESDEHKVDSIYQLLPFSYPIFTELAKISESRFGKIALVYGNFSDVLIKDAEYFKMGVTKKSSIAIESKLGSGPDFRTEIAKILATNPDAFTMFLPVDAGINFLKQMNSQKGDHKISLICDANMELAVNDYISKVGPEVLEGCISTNLPNLSTKEFVSQYKERYGVEPMMGADWGYDAIAIVKELATTPRDKWLEEIQSSSFDGVSGNVAFDETGTRFTEVEAKVFTGGKFTKLK